MTEVRVIARSVARKGNEDELRALLQGMLVPTRAEQGCKSYELYESDSTGRFYFEILLKIFTSKGSTSNSPIACSKYLKCGVAVCLSSAASLSHVSSK